MDRDQSEVSKTNDDHKVRSDIAVAEGYTMRSDPPEPKKCKYCGRTLYYYGLKSFNGSHEIFLWFQEPEKCTCEGAARYWEDQRRKKEEAETARKQQEEQDRLQRRIARTLKDSGIRGRFANRTFERYEVNDMNRRAYEKCKRYADSFPMMLPSKDDRGNAVPPQKERNGLFITGSYGTGKTHLACAIANQLIRGGKQVICMTMIDLLAKIKSTFESSDNTTEADVRKLYEDVPLLIIDDIGSEQATEWGSTMIYSIINARYEAYMPTIVTTNYEPDELIRRMTPNKGDRRNAEKTLDRLKEMCVGISMKWDSYRSR